MVLGVARVEPTASTCRVWAFLFNATGRGQQVAVRPHLRNAAGDDLDVVGYHPAGQSVDVASGHVLYLWPTFRGGGAADGLELSLDLQGYGRLHVPARERMTNLGPWEDLPAGVRDPLGVDFRNFGRFRWWER